MSTSPVAAADQRPSRRSRHRSRAASDPSRPGQYLTPPYTVQRPTPLVDHTPGGDALLNHPLLARPRSSSPPSATPPAQSRPRSPSPQRPAHHRSSSRHGPRAHPAPLVENLPPPPHRAGSVRSHNPPVLPNGGAQRHGSHHSASSATMFQNTTATHVAHSGYPSPVTTHHVQLPSRSRSRPPVAASHRYASTITPSIYGHGGSASNGSRTSLNGAHSQRHHRHPSLTSASYHPGIPAPLPSSPQRSHSHARSTSITSRTSATVLPIHDAMEIPPSPPTPVRGMLPSHKMHRRTLRPPLPANWDGETQTRYVRMLLALEDISPFYNLLAAFFTWILLAGFLLFPGTFASWQNESTGTPQNTLLSVVNHVPLYVIAWVCTGVGGFGMIWLWWRWYRNYIWLNTHIFVPGCLNSLAGVISTLVNVYGGHAGIFGEVEKSTIIVTAALTTICGTLMLVYIFSIRKLRMEHDHEFGHEYAGNHGEGFLGEKREMDETEGHKTTVESIVQHTLS